MPVPATHPSTTGNLDHAVARVSYEIREEANLSQRQLAARINVPRTYISKIENSGAHPTLKSVVRLCDALHVSAAEFMRRVDVIRLGQP